MERKIHFSENNIILRIVIILRILGEAKIFLGFGEQRQNTFRELMIILRDLGRTMHYFWELGSIDLPGGTP